MTMSRRLSLASLFVALLAVAGLACQADKTAPDVDAGAQDAGTALQADGAQVAEKEKSLPPLSADDLKPSYWQLGPSDAVPSALVVEFPSEIRHERDTPVGDQTDIRLEPEIEGTWRVEGRKRLVFRPKDSFKPGESYDVVVESVEVRRRNPMRDTIVEETVAPDEPWTYAFEMPSFQFVELLTPVASKKTSSIDVDVRFSAPPRKANLRKWASWRIDGEQPGNVTYERRENRPSVVRATFDGLDLGAPGAEIPVKLELAAGVPYDDETKAEAASGSTKIAFGEKVEIRDAAVQEGPDGFFIRVVCDDSSVSGEDNYYNLIGYKDYRDISTRCVPGLESAREHIEIEPSIGDITVSPATGGFRILGDFDRGNYDLAIKPGLATVDGGIVDEMTNKTLEVGPRSSLVQTVGTGRYIPPEAWNHLAVEHRNVDSVRVTIRHVPEQNLVFWLTGHDHDADSRTSNRVASKTVAVDGEPDATETSYLDLDSIVDERQKGVYQIELEGLQEKPPSERSDQADKWDEVAQGTSRLVLTDVNLIAKRADAAPDDAWSRSVDVWTREMRQNEPLSGVEVQAVRPSGYVLGSCTTTAGHCELDVQPKKTDPNGPFALIARTGDEVTFLEYSDLRTDVPKASVGGEPYLSEKPYRVSMWGDRDLYRPAETLHVAGVVRKSQLGRVKKGLPVELELTNPRGQSVRKRVVDTNAAGAFEFDYEFGDLADTGRWRLEARIGERESGEYTFFVEEFVPERMEVSVESKNKHVLAGSDAQFSVQADYLFGAPASESPVKLGCSVQPDEFKPEGYADYHFGHAPFEEETRDFASTSIGNAESKTDEEGAATVACGGTDVVGEYGARLDAQISVLEAGSGRSTDERKAVWVHPEKWLVGLQSEVDEVKEGEKFRVDGVVSTWKGEPSDAVDEVEVEFISLDRVYSWYRRYGGYGSSSDWRQIMTGRREVAVENGEFSFEVTPQQLDDAYAIRVKAGDATTTLQLDTDYYYWGYRGDETPEPQTPSEVPVDVDEPIEVGETTNVAFEAPFSGRALMTVETHGVRQHEWVDVSAGTNEWSFELEEFAPNVYVTAFVIKDPHLESEDAFVPRRAFGVSSVEVEPKQYSGDLQLGAPDEKRPSTQFEVEVDADVGDGPAWATVAVVDQGILQLTDYETPNPLDTLLAKRALGVDTFDTIGWNVRMPSMGEAAGGGARRPGAVGDKGRAMPVEPVAMWSGLVKLEDGKATIPFKLPQYRGEVRIMGAAVTSQRIATADTTMKVRDPLGLQATTPRFMTSGDRAEVPIFVTNQTGSTKKIDVSLASRPRPTPGVRTMTEGGKMLDVEAVESSTVTLEDGKSKTVRFDVEAVAPSGAAELTATASAEGHRSETSGTVPIQPATPEERKLQMLDVESGTMQLHEKLDGWVPRSERTTIRLTTVPYSDVLERLDHLIDYPYGCVEQTTSSTRPLLYLSDLAESIDPGSSDEFEEADDMVEAGIDRILSMQVSGGGFGYWPGATEPDPWGSAYATDLLVDAREAGFEVPESRLGDALDWISEAVEDSDHEYARPYMHYVLARADRGDRAAIKQAIESHQKEDEKLEGKEAEEMYLLKAALYLAGDRRYESDLKEMQWLFEAAAGQRQYGHSYYSGLRRSGLALTLHYNLFGETEESDAYVRQLVERMRDEGYMNTQEAAWGVTALGKAVSERKVPSELRNATLTIDGQKVERSSRDENDHPSWSIAHAADRNSVQLDVDVGDGTNWYLVVDSEGVRENPDVEYGDEGLKVRREYIDAEGDPVSPTQIELGELFYVRLDVMNNQGNDIDNVAIVDRLPAGLEIENPRLSGSADVLGSLVEMDGSRDGDSWWYDHMNVRDDRLQVFGDLESYSTREVVYGVRATLPGTFRQPLVEAHAMYVPGEWSRKRGGTIRIQSR